MIKNQILHYRQIGLAQGPSLIFLHGLLGSGINWLSIAHALAPYYRIILPDLRNHGRSFHHPNMDYLSMADDLIALLHVLNITMPTVIGHSMGGKAAMVLASKIQLAGLIVVDIAPVNYSNPFFSQLIQRLIQMPLDSIHSRQEAKNELYPWLKNEALIDYLLQNLAYEPAKGWYWRCSLEFLNDQIKNIQSFPDIQCPWSQKTLFIAGTQSDYIDEAIWTQTRRLCPQAKLRWIQSGHWVYAQQPKAFIRIVQNFLNQH